MEYICINEKGQVQFDLEDNLIQIPTGLHGFSNTKTVFYPQPFNGHDALLIFGNLRVTEQDRICPQCGAKMHINRQSVVVLHHLNFGSTYTNVGFRTFNSYAQNVILLSHNIFRFAPMDTG